eukprot:scaffold4832_cov115-Skeletonema_dohrnii-CCMP3373.AAC.6
MLFDAKEAIIRRDRASIDENKSPYLPNRAKNALSKNDASEICFRKQQQQRQYRTDDAPQRLYRQLIAYMIKLWAVLSV